MSVAISSFLSFIAIGKETTQGVEASTFPYLYASPDSDGLSFNETPYDAKALTGLRGQNSLTHRAVQNLPEGDLGKLPMGFSSDSTFMLTLLETHFQMVAETGSSAPYTYTFSPADDSIAEGSFKTLSIHKSTGVAGKNHLYTGCIADKIVIDWEQGGVLSITPSIKAMNSDYTEADLVAPNLPSEGFMQAPRIAVYYNGVAIHPSKFSITSESNTPDRQSGSARGRFNYAVGDYTGQISMDVWRNEDASDNYVAPFYADPDHAGEFMVIATIDSDYGEAGTGNPVTLTYTANVVLTSPIDMATSKDDLVDSVEFKVVNDTPVTLSITAENSGLV